MTRILKKVRKSLSGATENLFYKTPMGEDTLFGDCKIHVEKSDLPNAGTYSNVVGLNPSSTERDVSYWEEDLGYSSSDYDSLGDYPLVDERYVRFASVHSSHPSFSDRNGARASTTQFQGLPVPVLSPIWSSREPVADSFLQTCNICAEERQPREFPTTSITPTCTHPVTDACKECVRRHLASQLSSRGTATLYCICNQPLSLDGVQQNANPEDFARYSERATMELLESDSKFVWCPKPGCGAGQIQRRGSDEPKVTCVRCRQMYCFTHHVRWHTGMTCREFDQNPELADAVRETENTHNHAHRHQRELRDLSSQQRQALEATARERREREVQERENEEFVRRNARPCPSCKYMTQKDGGCKHVTCKSRKNSSCPITRTKCCNSISGVKCQFEFCWTCQKAWKAGHLRDSC